MATIVFHIILLNFISCSAFLQHGNTVIKFPVYKMQSEHIPFITHACLTSHFAVVTLSWKRLSSTFDGLFKTVFWIKSVMPLIGGTI